MLKLCNAQNLSIWLYCLHHGQSVFSLQASNGTEDMKLAGGAECASADRQLNEDHLQSIHDEACTQSQLIRALYNKVNKLITHVCQGCPRLLASSSCLWMIAEARLVHQMEALAEEANVECMRSAALEHQVEELTTELLQARPYSIYFQGAILTSAFARSDNEHRRCTRGPSPYVHCMVTGIIVLSA